MEKQQLQGSYLSANTGQLNLCAAQVKSFPADFFLDLVGLVEQLLIKVLTLDPDQGLDRLADQLAVRLQLLGLAPQLLVPARKLRKTEKLFEIFKTWRVQTRRPSDQEQLRRW